MIYLISFGMGIMLFLLSRYTTLPFLNDFYSYYIGGHLLKDGLPLYGITQSFKTIVDSNNFRFTWGTGYSYPPFLAIAMIPFSLLPFSIAGSIWISLQILLYGLFIKHTIKNSTLVEIAYILPFLLFFGPALGSIVNGQVNVVVLWCLYYYLYSQNIALRAFGIAIAGWIKVFPFLILTHDFLRKKLKFLYVFVSIFCLLLIVQYIPQFGLYIYDYFFNILPRLQSGFDPYITNQSLVGVASRIFGNYYSHSFIFLIEIIIFLVLSFITSKKMYKNNEVINLLWILSVLLLAGKNSYWNMLPSVFIYMFLLKARHSLNQIEQIILIISISISLVFPYILIVFMHYPHLLELSLGKAISSLGFFSLFMLYYPLIRRIYSGAKKSTY